MGASTQTRQPSLDVFFETIHAFHRTAALKAAIELDMFTGIGEGADTAEALARRMGASERGTRILCDYLTVIGFLVKTGDCYALSADSKMFLDRRSPAYVGGAIEFLLSPTQIEAFRDLAAVVRKGSTMMGSEGIVAPEHPVWVKFARAMAPLMRLPSDLLAGLVGADSGGKCKVLDMAAGHGLYGIAIAKRNPKAEIVALDWPNVLTAAQENARAAGVAERYSTIAGSALDVDYGSGYDLILLTNILHHFDPPAIEKMLRKVYAALKPGGRAAILEFIPKEDRVSPPVAAQFSMMMLATTPGGDAYTFSQYQRMLCEAGFTTSELNDLPPAFFRAVIALK